MTDAPTTPLVGVVTVSYGSDAVLPRMLTSLPAAVAEPYALVVADNRPTEETSAARLADEHGAAYVPLPSNPGYGAAVNAGVDVLPASVRWIVISNPDVVFQPGSVAHLIHVANADSSIGATGPAVENDDGSLYPSARSVPSLRTGVGHALLGSIWRSNPWTIAYLNGRQPAGEQRDVGWLSGSCLMVRRSAFEEIGGFDEGYFMYFEDVDLGYRLGKAGYRNVYVPSARVVHTGAHSTEGESARMIRAHHDSAKRFLAKKYRGWALWPVRAVLGLGLDARAALNVRRSSTHRSATA